MAEEMQSGAKHVLAYGTARTRAAAGKGAGKEGGGGVEGKNVPAGGEKKLSHIEVHPDSKGPGRHMVHKHHPPHDKPEHDERYSVGDQAVMHAHLDEHMPEAAGEEEAAAGAPNPEEEAAAAAGAGGAGGGAPGGMAGV